MLISRSAVLFVGISRIVHIMPKTAAGGFYAVGVGRQVGLFKTWAECENSVKGFPNAKFKKFSTEGEAQDFVRQHSNTSSSGSNQMVSSNSILKHVSGFTSNAIKKPKFQASPKAAQNFKRSVGAILLDSPLRVNETKRVRNESPNLKSVLNGKGDKTFLPFIVDEQNNVNVFVDGACVNNGQKGARAGVGVWFGDDHPLNISEPVDGPPTNNTAEIQAARLAIEVSVKAGFERLRVNTDSAFLIQCVTQWMRKWKTNGWKLTTGGDVKNRIELEKLDKAMQNIFIEWTKVPAHSGVHGNEMADQLAGKGALRY